MLDGFGTFAFGFAVQIPVALDLERECVATQDRIEPVNRPGQIQVGSQVERVIGEIPQSAPSVRQECDRG